MFPKDQFQGIRRGSLFMKHTPVVLIVDDEIINLKLMKAYVTSFGYKAICAKSGEEALKKVKMSLPDIILLDINLPEMNGHTLLKELKYSRKSRYVPVIMISASRAIKDRIKSLREGASEYLIKPVNQYELKTQIEVLLSHKKYEDYLREHQTQLQILLEGKKDQLQETLKSYARFVPSEFLKILDKKKITDVSLGDQKLQKMIIMFSDIRSFTTLSEKMTPQENFNFLNSYLKRMNPCIWKNGGFIDKYIGDAIMALFPNDSESAIISALDMLKHLGIYNEHRSHVGYDPIRIGVSIHKGDVMLGIIGHEHFLQGTVISDAVNLTSRMETLTKKYGISIIVSNNIIFDLKDPSKFNIRFLDKIKVKGKKEPVSVFEVFNGDDEYTRDIKLKNQDAFEKGAYLYHSGDIEQSFKIFTELKSFKETDKAIRIYKERCEYYFRNGSLIDTLKEE